MTTRNSSDLSSGWTWRQLPVRSAIAPGLRQVNQKLRGYEWKPLRPSRRVLTRALPGSSKSVTLTPLGNMSRSRICPTRYVFDNLNFPVTIQSLIQSDLCVPLWSKLLLVFLFVCLFVCFLADENWGHMCHTVIQSSKPAVWLLSQTTLCSLKSPSWSSAIFRFYIGSEGNSYNFKWSPLPIKGM